MMFTAESDFLEAVAQFDFTARSPRELSLKKGETLVLYAQVSSDWWKGSNKEFKGKFKKKESYLD